jgi:type VI secretion system protein ImpA
MTDLLSPIEDAAPCGPDLEYDAALLELDRTAAGKPEREAGGVVIPAEDPDWSAVRTQSIELFARTKDLRVAVLYTRAAMHLDGVQGLVGGLQLVHGLLEQYWPHVHPLLDASDDDDPTMRLNALAAIADPDTTLRGLRTAVWLDAAGVRVTVRQGLASLGAEAPLADGQPSEGQIDGMLGAIAQRDPVNHARVAIETARAIAALVESHLGAGRGIEVTPLRRMLSPLADRFDRVVGTGADAAAADGEQATDTGASASFGGAFASGPIRSRDDASRALDAVCAYLERSEPSNPAPLLIRRAQRLMTMGFLDIMRELAPDALPAVEHIAGSPPSTDP